MKTIHINTIHINISGASSTGKSALLATIRDAIASHGYCVAVPERGERNNPSKSLEDAAPHEKPKYDSTVIVLTETCTGA